MREDMFKEYVKKVFSNPRVQSDCVSRCKRVDRVEGDLDKHHIEDECKSLLCKLDYSKEEANNEIQPKHSIKFNGNKGFQSIYEGTQSLKNAVKVYVEFCNYCNK